MRPKISIVIPIHNMQGGAEFLWRSVNALTEQTFTDWELIITKSGKMAENTNEGIKRAHGELIKILYLDDYLAHKNALQDIVDAFTGQWLVTASDNNLNPSYTDDCHLGNNKLGSPSALTIRNDDPLLFDETLSWLLDGDYYKRMYERHGPPVILQEVGVNIGVGDHQMTYKLSDQDKQNEFEYTREKYQ